MAPIDLDEAPDRLSRDFLDEKLDALDGWREDAGEIAKDADEEIQPVVERLTAAMTDEERHAAWELYAAAQGVLKGIAERVYEQEKPPRRQLPKEDVVGLCPAVFIRCLATYDASQAHLSTWLTIESRQLFRRYIRKRRERDAGKTTDTIRKAIYKADVISKNTRGRRATLDEVVEVARSKGVTLKRETLRSRIRQLRSEADPLSLDEPWGDEQGEDRAGYEVLGSERVGPGPQIERIGERLAERWGKQGLWEDLTGVHEVHDARAQSLS